ncbi:hypothetical protein J2Z83_003756 [Virgibacillus natechei]|uniref:TMhelix containing protein n=1 Tax=Virgibacillus natechei TaxID=1216297 RepID=A0ABS4IKW7_9BACI|nr:hypothetical protein [Virgibacillus natechei]MBP1971605.1 hypothetical protein [Virgibacillus natechei]UZD13064.1 hypothetical protein OLD84_00345 [Virgibacillus natechei]
MLEVLINTIWIFFIYCGVAVAWVGAEKLIYGKITPRKLDDVIAMTLAVSLFFNFS